MCILAKKDSFVDLMRLNAHAVRGARELGEFGEPLRHFLSQRELFASRRLHRTVAHVQYACDGPVENFFKFARAFARFDAF